MTEFRRVLFRSEYLKALEAAFDNLVDDLVAARMDLVQSGFANRRELLHTAPPMTFVSPPHPMHLPS